MISRASRKAKLGELADLQGFDTVEEMLEASATDSVCPGICISPDCDYTTETEPDQDAGWCESCDAPTVQSALILAGLI